ncbi:MAG: helix-turn-helix domain-containing protein [Oscillospiraceae bacterium]|jgi:transcriptional regulator with XRE-family HTH domain|nr:helix-turn-helix domain-containing protein [Oscillospiraceae bacterium]
MLDNYKIGDRIALLRKERGLTGEKFAEALGVSPQAVSKWENGKCLPETALLPVIAALLGVSVDEILLLDTPKNTVSAFINRNYSVPEEYILDWDPRISRWSPPEGCDMWYSFPAAIATALVCVEAKEQNRTAIPYAELNERFRDLMHITAMGYGFYGI